MERLDQTERVAAHIDALDWQSISVEEFGLAHLAEVGSGVGGCDVLLLERFDLIPGGNRCHLLTANALLKEAATQRDSGLVFRYDDVAGLLSRHSVAIEADLKQLARLAMFNRAINNTDDHSRNFSLINGGEGYRLAPAYDLVPQLAMGDYHAAGFSNRPNPPKPSEISTAGRMFGLSTTWLRNCADEVMAGIGRWGEFAERAGVDGPQQERLRRLFNP